jgi:hypothetical protein
LPLISQTRDWPVREDSAVGILLDLRQQEAAHERFLRTPPG